MPASKAQTTSEASARALPDAGPPRGRVEEAGFGVFGGEKNAHTRLSLTLEVEHCFQGLEVLYTGTTTTKNDDAAGTERDC